MNTETHLNVNIQSIIRFFGLINFAIKLPIQFGLCSSVCNGPISLAGAASLGKCGYGNGIAVMERISGTVLVPVRMKSSHNQNS